MQLLAVAYGGTLHQHLPDVLGHERHRPAPGVYGAHPAPVRPGQPGRGGSSATAPRSTATTTRAVADPGTLTVTGWAEDGLIEAVEDPARPVRARRRCSQHRKRKGMCGRSRRWCRAAGERLASGVS